MLKRINRLSDLCIKKIASADVRAPFIGEPEPQFSASVLSPILMSYISGLEVAGLHVGGDGAGPVSIAPFMGRALRPDLTVLSFSSRLVSFEVKYVRYGSASSDMAKAVGQATLYRAFGFHRSVIVLIDQARSLRREHVAAARPKLLEVGVEVVVRQRVLDRLTADEDVLLMPT